MALLLNIKLLDFL